MIQGNKLILYLYILIEWQIDSMCITKNQIYNKEDSYILMFDGSVWLLVMFESEENTILLSFAYGHEIDEEKVYTGSYVSINHILI